MEDVVESMRNRDIDVSVVRGDAFQVRYEAQDPGDRDARHRAARAALHRRESARPRGARHRARVSSSTHSSRRRAGGWSSTRRSSRTTGGSTPASCRPSITSNLTGASNSQMQVQSLNDTLERDRDASSCSNASWTISRAQSPYRRPPLSWILEAGRTRICGTAARGGPRRASQIELRLKPEHPDIVRMKRLICGPREARRRPRRCQSPSRRTARATSPGRDRRGAPDEGDSGTTSRHSHPDLARREQDAERGFATSRRVYQARAEAAPTRETELIELMRDYNTLADLYADLLAKSEESKMAADSRDAARSASSSGCSIRRACPSGRSARIGRSSTAGRRWRPGARPRVRCAARIPRHHASRPTTT